MYKTNKSKRKYQTVLLTDHSTHEPGAPKEDLNYRDTEQVAGEKEQGQEVGSILSLISNAALRAVFRFLSYTQGLLVQ